MIKERGPIAGHTIALPDVTKAAIDTLSLYRSGGDSLSPFGAIGIVWLKSAFPESLSNENIHDSKDLKHFNHMVKVGMEINDVVDIIPQARKMQQQEIVNSIFSGWKRAMRAASSDSDNSHQDPEKKRQRINDYQREILFYERHFREVPQDDLNIERTIYYREMINSITIVNNAAALLGDEVLPDRLNTIEKNELSADAIEKKYGWIVAGDTNTEEERRLHILLNLAMGIQALDDWYDVEYDRKLGLNTIATQVLDNSGGASEAKNDVSEIANNYLEKARNLGVSRSTIVGIRQVFILLKKSLIKYPQMGGRRERLLSGFNI